MRLTATLVDAAPSYVNALGDRQLELRRLQIPLVENLGAARDIHDALDLTANDLRQLANFPRMPRVRVLLLAGNRVSRIDVRLAEQLPGLEAVVLTGNAVAELRELEGLVRCGRLEWLSLLGCPVTTVKGYREWVVWRLPGLRVLDFSRVRERERVAARALYGPSHDQPTEAARAILTAAAAIAPSALPSTATAMSARDQEQIRRAIREAKTLDEVRRLESLLRSGHIPRGVLEETGSS